ncbi:hypothetical protein T01_9729, partial [Trichinella spiralis]
PAKSDNGRTGADPEEANQTTPPSGSLQWGPEREVVVRGIGNACYGPPPTFSPGMDPVEWLESMKDFFVVTGVPSSQQAASTRLSVNIAVRRELFSPGSPRHISWNELKRRFLDIYGHGRRDGKSEKELVARFICGVASKEVHRELRLREPTILVKAHQLAENAAELETEVGESQQRTTENADAGNDNLAQAVEALTRRFDQLQTTLERSNSRRPARRATECFRCGEQGHFLRDCPQLRTRTRPARALNNGNRDLRLLAMTELQAGHAPSVAVPLSIWYKSAGGEPLEAAGGSILLSDGRRVRLCGQGTLPLQLIDWQAGEMTMTDGSRVRITHEPAPATRPGIGCAWITASPQEVPREETVGEGPETNSGELEACERALVDRAECSAQNRRVLRSLPRRTDWSAALLRYPGGAVKLDAANPIKQWQESDKELQQIRKWSTQRTWPQVAPEGSRLLRSLWSQRDRIVVHEGTICRKWETPDTGETRLLQVIPRQRIPEILAAIHNQQSGDHLGVAKTLAKVRQRYYWPQQREDVEDWCRACQTCA